MSRPAGARAYAECCEDLALVAALSSGAQRLLGAAPPGSAEPLPGRPQGGAVVRPGTIRLHKGLLTLRASAGPSTEAGRHALRLAAAATLTALLAQVTRLPHDYWAVLTVIFVLQPDYSSALHRVVQRAGGR